MKEWEIESQLYAKNVYNNIVVIRGMTVGEEPREVRDNIFNKIIPSQEAIYQAGYRDNENPFDVAQKIMNEYWERDLPIMFGSIGENR